MFELPCFNNRQTVYSSLERMVEDRVIGAGTSGELLGYATEEGGFATASDKEGAYCVLDTLLPGDLVAIGADDAKEHGMLKACIFAEMIRQPDEWKKLSASALAKVLPYKRLAIQLALQEMLRDGWLIPHDAKPKLYKRGEGIRPRADEIILNIEVFSLI